MNRRNFIGGLLAAGASFYVLPGAGRIWRPSPKIITCAEAAEILPTFKWRWVGEDLGGRSGFYLLTPPPNCILPVFIRKPTP